MYMTSRYSDDAVRELALGVLNELKQYGTEGLPACYANVDDYLYDLYPDFPWDWRIIDSIQIIFDHPDFPAVRQLWLDRYQFDFSEEFNKTIAFEKANQA